MERFAAIGKGLESFAEKLEKRDIPKLIRNVMLIASGAMSIYIMASAVGAMMPQARQIFVQLGAVLGYIVPLMINVMVVSMIVGLVKILLR